MMRPLSLCLIQNRAGTFQLTYFKALGTVTHDNNITSKVKVKCYTVRLRFKFQIFVPNIVKNLPFKSFS